MNQIARHHHKINHLFEFDDFLGFSAYPFLLRQGNNWDLKTFQAQKERKSKLIKYPSTASAGIVTVSKKR